MLTDRTGDYIQSAINESLDDNQKEVFLDQMANLSIHVLELINKITTLHGTPIMLKVSDTSFYPKGMYINNIIDT